MSFFYRQEITSGVMSYMIKKIKANFGYLSCHWHDCYELIYVCSGSIRLIMDLNEFILDEGDTALIYPGIIHDSCSFSADKNAPLPELIVFQFYLTYLNISGESKISEYTDNLRLFLNSSHYADFIIKNGGEYSEQIGETVNKIFGEAVQKREGFDYFIKAQLYMLLGYLKRSGKRLKGFDNILDGNGETGETFDIGEICRYIESNCVGRLTLEHMAVHTGYTKNYFSEKFKRAVGNSFKAYLDFVRMRLAQRMLLSEKLTVTDVAYRLGYDNAQNLCRAFRRVTGISPGECIRLRERAANMTANNL